MKLDKILKNTNFEKIKNLSENEIFKIRLIRNEKKIRKNMTNSTVILKKNHLNWHREILASKINHFYGIKYDDELVGGLGLKNYNNKLLVGEWSFYISEKKNFIGLGATIEFMAINFFFKKFKLKKLYCYVLEHNFDVIKLHKKFGFNKISFSNYVKNINMEKQVRNAIYLSLEKKKWKNINKLIYKRYFLNDKK